MLMMRDRHDRELVHRRRRRLRRVSILPSLLTSCNLLCGFAALHFAAKDTTLFVLQSVGAEQATVAEGSTLSSAAHLVRNPMLKWLSPTLLGLACWFVFFAMINDALDGAAARWTRSAGEFGGQLDSLADVVSFGAAPAFIVIALLQRYALTDPMWLPTPVSGNPAGRVAWLMAGSFVICAALRLARFNVENSPDPDAHLWFRGLPSPGAAGAVVSLVILHEEVLASGTSRTWMSGALAKGLPVAALGLALLMVSRIRYPHLVSQYVRGKKPFKHLVKVVLILVMLLIHPQLALAALFVGYALYGPAAHLFRRIRPKTEVQPAGAPTEAPTPPAAEGDRVG